MNSATDGPAAETQFSLIQHAYAILSDPHKRAVYDLLGEEGLREIGDSEEAEGGGEGGGRRTGWKVIRRLGSPEEVSFPGSYMIVFADGLVLTVSSTIRFVDITNAWSMRRGWLPSKRWSKQRCAIIWFPRRISLLLALYTPAGRPFCER
jgi:curved DNA-binding protein CbpA